MDKRPVNRDSSPPYINSMTAAINVGANAFYYGRTNSQDGDPVNGTGGTTELNSIDMFDFAFRSSTNPNGSLVPDAVYGGPQFRHVPLPYPVYDAALDPAPTGWENWGTYDDTFTYRFYKSNAAWESFAPAAAIP
jgi:hypothetical protein